MKEMICNSCGKEIPDSSKFCTYCGAENTQKSCPHCGHIASPDSVFCSNCGKYVVRTPKSAPNPPEEPIQYDPVIEQPSSPKKIGCLGLFFLGLGIILVVMIISFLLDPSSANTSGDTSQPSTQSSSSSQSTSLFNSTGKIYDAATDFANSHNANAFKQYKDLYSYSNAVIIEKGSTVDVNIVWGIDAYIICEADTSVVSPKWSDTLGGRTATLSLTGLKEGTSTLRVYSEATDHELYLLAIVVDADSSSRGSTGTAGQVYNSIKDFAKNTEANAFKKYNEFFTYSNAVIIKKGTTVDVSVACANNCTIYWSATDMSVVNPDWSGDSWVGGRAKLTVSGVAAGASEIILSNSFNDHELKILAIVVD